MLGIVCALILSFLLSSVVAKHSTLEQELVQVVGECVCHIWNALFGPIHPKNALWETCLASTLARQHIQMVLVKILNIDVNHMRASVVLLECVHLFVFVNLKTRDHIRPQDILVFQGVYICMENV